jgi:hypothetical protein
MTKVLMTAVDQLHLSEVGPDTLAPGAEFETSETFAAELEKRGLATRAAGKAASAPDNKAEPAPDNKAVAPEAKPPIAVRKVGPKNA